MAQGWGICLFEQLFGKSLSIYYAKLLHIIFQLKSQWEGVDKVKKKNSIS